MADITVVAADVLRVSGNTKHGVAGAVITAGQTLYLDSATNTLKLADCDGAAALAAVVGIALNGGAVGQTISYLGEGEIDIGGTVVVGELYVLSGNAGFIAAEGDLATNDALVIIGYGKTVTNILLDINNTLITVA